MRSGIQGLLYRSSRQNYPRQVFPDPHVLTSRVALRVSASVVGVVHSLSYTISGGHRGLAQASPQTPSVSVFLGPLAPSRADPFREIGDSLSTFEFGARLNPGPKIS